MNSIQSWIICWRTYQFQPYPGTAVPTATHMQYCCILIMLLYETQPYAAREWPDLFPPFRQEGITNGTGVRRRGYIFASTRYRVPKGHESPFWATRDEGFLGVNQPAASIASASNLSMCRRCPKEQAKYTFGIDVVFGLTKWIRQQQLHFEGIKSAP